MRIHNTIVISLALTLSLMTSVSLFAQKKSAVKKLNETVNEEKPDAETAAPVEGSVEYLPAYDDASGKGFDCASFCKTRANIYYDNCIDICSKAEEKANTRRQQKKHDKPVDMELIPAGAFLMGNDDDCFFIECFSSVETITFITNDFYIDKYEVTQKEFARVMGSNPSYYKGAKCGDDCPVESVTWDEAASYCNAVGKRLPTAAEWEYAARGGTTTMHYWGNEVDPRYLWYKYNSGKRPKPVGGKLPNNYGLYDMEGNVFEYVQDCISYSEIVLKKQMWLQNNFYRSNPSHYDQYIDPLYVKDKCETRQIRGGSFAYEGKGASVFIDYDQNVNERRGDRGFRCVMDVYTQN